MDQKEWVSFKGLRIHKSKMLPGNTQSGLKKKAGGFYGKKHIIEKTCPECLVSGLVRDDDIPDVRSSGHKNTLS